MTKISKNIQTPQDLAGNLFIGLLLVVFGGIVLHAPISVGLQTLWPDYGLLIKSWKEILMLIAGVVALWLMYKKGQFEILHNPIIVLIGLFALLHLVLLPFNFQGAAASTAGLAIDLRYLLFFSLVYIAMRLYPECRRTFIRIGIVGALVVVVFSLLQVFILPYDFLKYLGYNKDTIIPYLYVDQNSAFVRINSTLRGPNPLGAYALVILSLVSSAIVRCRVKKEKWLLVMTVVLSVGGVTALWASYSRSALVGAFLAIAIVLVTVYSRKFTRNAWVILGVILVILTGGLFTVRNTDFISNVILHDNPNRGSSSTSNEAHLDSLSEGTSLLLRQPLGAGIGSTGSASILGDQAQIIENHYLFVAHESGWLGLALFMSIFGLIMSGLWRLRSNWLALGVFASGVGLAAVGLFLPVWADDTVSIIWWGLAAIALSYPQGTRIYDKSIT